MARAIFPLMAAVAIFVAYQSGYILEAHDTWALLAAATGAFAALVSVIGGWSADNASRDGNIGYCSLGSDRDVQVRANKRLCNNPFNDINATLPVFAAPINPATLSFSAEEACVEPKFAVPALPLRVINARRRELLDAAQSTNGRDRQWHPVSSRQGQLPPRLASTTAMGLNSSSLGSRSMQGSRTYRAGSLVRRAADVNAETAAEPETFEFQAEVARVMDIIINSLYSDKDVFLRELVSNAADACDKKRFLSVQSENASLGAATSMDISIRADRDKNQLIIEDRGVGMTREELKTNLGRIAKSGTKSFVESLGTGEADVSLIGQFGVGFYSAYLVADKVTVVTRSYTDGAEAPQLRWESEAGASYTISEDDGSDGEPPLEGSGTRMILQLKEDCDEYLDEFKLREMLKKYSEFITVPIRLWATRTDYVQEPDPDADPPAEGEPPAMKTVAKQTTDWEVMNKQQPIWVRNPKDVTDDDHKEFYRTAFAAYDEPLAHKRFSLEGQYEFRGLLYVPSALPFELSRDMFDTSSKAFKLYVKRVFINDKFEQLAPRWLTFLRGLVDSEDLPLNISREILQQSKVLNVIQRTIKRKAVDLFSEIAEDDEKFYKFYRNYGRYLKVGVIEDDDVKKDLVPLLRFPTSKTASTSDDGEKTNEDASILASLAEVKGRMREGQQKMYYATGDSKDAVLMSPALEKFRAKGIEVIFLTEPLDELTIQAVGRFEDVELVDVSQADALGDDVVDDEEKKAVEEKSKELEGLCEWLKDEALAGKVQGVAVSARLTDSPAALVQGAYGMSPTMQRYMRAQAVAMGEDENSFMGAPQDNQVTLEINADHPVVVNLKEKFETGDKEAATDFAMLMYDIASISSGYPIGDVSSFTKRVTGFMSS